MAGRLTRTSREPTSSEAPTTSQVGQLAAHLQLSAGELALTFDPLHAMNVRIAGALEPRSLNLGGRSKR